jgi:protein-tyrosine phosphatase
VLVHCHAGMQRSCAIVACYLVKYYDMTSYESISFIRAKRHIAFLYSINFLETINLVLFDNKNNNKKIDL